MKKTKVDAVQQYEQYYHNGDRQDIFKLLVDHYGVQRALYPGSYIHIAPSFYIPTTVYIDSYEKTEDFFNDKTIFEYISKNRSYKKIPIVRYHYSNYNLDFGEKVEDFDLLISLHAGFISQSCKKYLKNEGILLVNNSHGDAGMAYLDKYYEFIAAIYRSNRQYRLTDKNLDKYFILKNPDLQITQDYLKRFGRGVGYTKTASVYVFKKLKKETN
jgi:hypothetical protein